MPAPKQIASTEAPNSTGTPRSKPVAAPESVGSGRFIGIEIGGTKLQLVVGTADGVILGRQRYQVDRARGAEGICEKIAEAIPQLIAAHSVCAIGVGYGGPVHWRTGQVAKSYHIPGWSDFPLGSWLYETTGLAVFVENDGFPLIGIE